MLRFKCVDVFSGRLVNYVGRMAPHNQARDLLTLRRALVPPYFADLDKMILPTI